MKAIRVLMPIVALTVMLSSAQAAQPIVVQTNLGPGHTQLVVTGTGGSQDFAKPFQCTGSGDGTYKVAGSMLKVGLSSGTSVLRVTTGISNSEENHPAEVFCAVNGAGDLSCTARPTGSVGNPGAGNGSAACKGTVSGAGTVITALCSCEKQ